ncbi:MAG: tRNA lysidine(34) synthetase TilS [Vicinamibacterales bacterium]|nr:tRNA lysidine(34) synthetase TilS [Vicinamibacterales bacterium]
MSAIRARVRRTIQRHGLCPPGSRLLVALSGGSDSVALLHLLHDLAADGGFSVAAVAHVNHHLRATAGRDEDFCRELVARLGYPLDVAHADVAARARRDGLSIEEAARQERYRSLREAAGRHHATLIATGHTRDDQVETLLMKLGRGAGLSGLGGVYPRRDDLVRPLLEVSRDALRDYLRQAGEPWVEDETNADLTNPRNRIRHTVVPAIEAALGPGALDAIARATVLAGEDGRWLDSLAAEAHQRLRRVEADGLVFDQAALLALPAPLLRRVLLLAMREQARPAQIGTTHVEAAGRVVAGEASASDSPAGRWELSGSTVVLLSNTSTESGPFSYELPVPGVVHVPEAAASVEALVEPRGVARVVKDELPGAAGPARGEGQAVTVLWTDETPLVVRSRRPGDWLRLAAGRKKLQDVFVDAKVPRGVRDTLPVVTDSAGRVVWVPGYAVSEDFRVDPAEGKVILLRFTPMGE